MWPLLCKAVSLTERFGNADINVLNWFCIVWDSHPQEEKAWAQLKRRHYLLFQITYTIAAQNKPVRNRKTNWDEGHS